MLGNRIADVATASPSRANSADGANRPTERRESRWRIVIPAAAVLVLLVAGFSWIYVSTRGAGGDSIDLSSLDASAAAPTATTPVTPSTTADPASASSAEQQTAATLVSEARADSSSFDQIGAATSAGYRTATALSLRSLRVGGVRYEVKPSQIDGAVDPSRPGGLMYRRTATGYELVGELFLGVSGDGLAHPAGALAPWYPTALRTKRGATVEVLPVWFGAGVLHPFALTWDGATAA